MYFLQNIPPHIHYVATLPCETKVLASANRKNVLEVLPTLSRSGRLGCRIKMNTTVKQKRLYGTIRCIM